MAVVRRPVEKLKLNSDCTDDSNYIGHSLFVIRFEGFFGIFFNLICSELGRDVWKLESQV